MPAYKQLLALLTLVGSSFFKEIRRTFGQHVLGMRALTLWEAAFCVLAVAWAASLVIGALCLSHKQRTRSLGGVDCKGSGICSGWRKILGEAAKAPVAPALRWRNSRRERSFFMVSS